jgi:hypothetical protein
MKIILGYATKYGDNIQRANDTLATCHCYGNIPQRLEPISQSDSILQPNGATAQYLAALIFVAIPNLF